MWYHLRTVWSTSLVSLQTFDGSVSAGHFVRTWSAFQAIHGPNRWSTPFFVTVFKNILVLRFYLWEKTQINFTSTRKPKNSSHDKANNFIPLKENNNEAFIVLDPQPFRFSSPTKLAHFCPFSKMFWKVGSVWSTYHFLWVLSHICLRCVY